MRQKIVSLFGALILLAGAGIYAYPKVSNLIVKYNQEKMISQYLTGMEQVAAADIDEMLEEAEAYNETLVHASGRWLLTDEQTAQYNALLDTSGDGVMGYIEIPAIKCTLPIRHGVDDAVLQTSIGHIPGSSLPVGGVNTHAVVSGHRGLPSAQLFTNLDRVAKGDIFTITTLGRTLTYQVDQILVTLPEDAYDYLGIERGEDLCTLITCTPYGVNTHRLLVRGHRIDTEEDAALIVVTDAERIPVRYVSAAAALPFLLLWLIVFAAGRRKKRGREVTEA